MRFARASLGLALSLTFGAAAACAASNGITGGSPANPVSVSSDEMDTIRAVDLFPLQPQSGVYERSRGERAGRQYEYEVRQQEEDWVLEVKDRHRLFLRIADDGGIHLHRYENLRQDINVAYEPAMLMLPGRLDDQVHEGEVRMRIEGVLGRASMGGRATYRLHTAGTREVPTPNGPEQAYIVIQEQSVSIPLARANVRLETAYVPGMGRVLDHVQREHRVLGLFGDSAEETYQLAQ